MKKIICIGSATKDIFLLLDEVRILDNEQDLTAKKLMAFEYGAKVYANQLVEEVGGSAVNVAAGLTQSGYRAFVFSRTSRGEIGKWILKRISQKKIKKNYMQQNGGRESEVAIILLDGKTIEHVIFRTGDSLNNFSLAKALERFREKVDWIFVGSQKENWQKNLPLAIEFAQKKKALIALNPSSYQISKTAKELVSYLGQIEVLFVNRDEALEIVEKVEKKVQDDPRFLYEKLLSYGPRVVAITDAENGAYAGDAQGCYFLDVAATKKIDAVGAGDAFASGFLSCYIEEADVKKALAWGIANSAGAVSRLGGSNGLLNRKELKAQEKNLLGKIKEII